MFMKTLTHRKRGQNQAEGKCARPKTQADLKIPHNKDPNNHTNVSLGIFFFDIDQVSFSAICGFCSHRRRAQFRWVCCSLIGWNRLDISVSDDNRKHIQNPDSLQIHSRTSSVLSWFILSEFLDYPSWIKQTDGPERGQKRRKTKKLNILAPLESICWVIQGAGMDRRYTMTSSSLGLIHKCQRQQLIFHQVQNRRGLNTSFNGREESHPLTPTRAFTPELWII